MNSEKIREVRAYLEGRINDPALKPTERKKMQKAAMALYDAEFIVGRNELQNAIRAEFKAEKPSSDFDLEGDD
jgi:hypothetical protein